MPTPQGALGWVVSPEPPVSSCSAAHDDVIPPGDRLRPLSRRLYTHAVDVRDVDRGLRASLWPTLRTEGFVTRTTRAGWRYWDGGVEVLDVQSVGASADAVGCTSFSFSAYLGSAPDFLPSFGGTPIGRDGRRRPHYWNCPLEITLNKRIAQPWFKAFAREPAKRLTDAAAKHREGLRQVLRTDVHERPDIWYVLEDGSNLGAVVDDLTDVVMAALPDLVSLRDPCITATRVERGDFGSPGSPRATELTEAANAACLGRT